MAYSYATLGVNNHVTFGPRGHDMVSGALSVFLPILGSTRGYATGVAAPQSLAFNCVGSATQNIRGWGHSKVQ